jgi:hypothetical protein
MKTLSVLLFTIIFIFVIHPDFKQNSVLGQNPVCVYCEVQLPNGVHKEGCPYYIEHGKKESKSSSNDIRLTIIQSLINFIFSDKSTDNKEKERQLIEQKKELEKIAIENEKQRILKEKIEQDLHEKFVNLYMKLPGSEELEEIKLSDYFKDKSFDGDGKELEYIEIDIKSPVDLSNNAEVESLVKQEQIKYETNFDEWVKDNNGDILMRLKDSDPYLSDLVKSIKTKAPPPLPPTAKKLDDLKPGDVLLVGNYFPNPITGLDKVFSGTLNTNASHTLLYLKEIGGQKMFLDHQPGKGEKIITELEFFKIYGSRPMEVAQYIAQPVSSGIGDKLYSAAFDLVGENEQYKHDNSYKIFTGTKYGLVGDDMVCSEADRWVLRKAGFLFPETENKIKKIMGVDYSPADYSKSGYFQITPFDVVHKY